MQNKINNLIDIYINNKDKYLFDEVDNLKFDENENINISLAFANGKYNIFVFLLENNSILFKVLYMQSENDLSKEYNNLKEDMNSLNADDFIDKHYETIIKSNS